MTTLQTTKFSFAEHTASVDAAKINSDLQNLASALQYTRAAKVDLDREYQKKLKEIEEHGEKIVKLATEIEAGEITHYDSVHELYQKSRRLGPSL